MTTTSLITPNARLDIVLPQDSHTAVILRRGPAKWVRMIKWNLKNDTFELGQWFNGRVREESCDLSPDGTHFIYGASKVNGRTLQDEEVGKLWTAVSRPPYFTALALWKAGCCAEGGHFLSNSQISLNFWPDSDNGASISPTKGMLPGNVDVVVGQPKSGTPKTGSWRKEEGALIARDHPLLHFLTLKMKRRLRENNPIPGHRGQFHFYVETKTGPVGLIDVTWADWDYRGRLVFVRGGKLFAADMAKRDFFDEAVELADFNDMTPEAIVAPDWATRW